MKFALQADGAAAAGQGIGNLFKAYVLGDQYRQKAEDDALLSGARMAAQRASAESSLAAARKYNAAADLDAHQLGLQKDPLNTALLQLGLPTAQAPAFRQRLETGSFGPSFEAPADGVGPIQPPPATPETVAKLGQSMALLQRLYGTGSNVAQGAQAAETEQTMRDREAIIAGRQQPLPTGQAYFATSGKAPFGDADPGLSRNLATGGIIVGNQPRANADIEEVLSRIFENRAQGGASQASAGLSNARRERVVAGLDRPQTIVDEDTGQATIVTLPTQGAPKSVGVAPPKGTGADATNAKTRNAVIAAVEKDLPGADEATILSEVNKRLARRGLPAVNSLAQAGDKNPASPAGAANNSTQPAKFSTADDVRAAFKAGKLTRDQAMAILQKDFGMK